MSTDHDKFRLTEEWWLSLKHPDCLLDEIWSKASNRKLHFYALAAVSTLRDCLEFDESLQLLKVYERFADGGANRHELNAAAVAADAAFCKYPPSSQTPQASASALTADLGDMVPDNPQSWDRIRCYLPTFVAQATARWTLGIDSDDVTEPECAKLRQAGSVTFELLAHFVRDIFGNPFRSVTLDPRWLSSTVLDLARTIYDEFPRLSQDPQQTGGYVKMHILADALMDAGCDNDEIIKHRHGPGLHVRGCWVVDLLLGKE